MVRIGLEGRPLLATAGLVWSVDLPGQLQQILFEAAAGVVSPGPSHLAGSFC